MRGRICLTAVCISIVIILNFAQVNCQNGVIIDAGRLGRINGATLRTMGPSARNYYSFNGIPYAKKPERFKPSEKFDGPLTEDGKPFKAILPGLACMQPSVVPPFNLPQDEDCLTINVHTPRLPQMNPVLLPVIIFIHGGAFTTGTGSLYNGNRLLNRDVVIASFNYRLGSFGFFYLETEDAPGNAAIYDMVNALKWVKENIVYFGGDPNRITISGQSSGSVSVTHLLASPMAHGLYRNVLGSSGSALATWGTARDPMSSSIRMAEISGCNITDAGGNLIRPEVAKCMTALPARDLVQYLYEYQLEERRAGRLGFDAVSAVVQDFTPTTPTFEKVIPEHPKDVFEDGRQANVPLLMGANRHDGSYVLGVLWQRFLKPNGLMNNTEFMKHEMIPTLFKALDIQDEFGIENSITKLYLGETRKTGNFDEMYPGFIDLLSVFFFKSPAYQTALYQSRVNNNTYWYSFDYVGKNSMFSLLFGIEQPPFKPGIGHGDDLIYLFQTTLLDLNAADYVISNRMVDYYVDFATYGTPTPPTSFHEPWPHLTESETLYNSIGVDSVILDHFEDTWVDVGWEVLPPTTPTTTKPTEAPSTTDPSNTDPTTDGGANISFNLSTLLLAVTFMMFRT